MNSTIQTKNRIDEIDLCRVLCILWIVGFWHMYKSFPKTLYPSTSTIYYMSLITDVVLACFTFLSGFLLKRYSFYTWFDIKTFYKKRFWRFFVLFSIASLAIFVIYYRSSEYLPHLFSTLLGFSLITSTTMWSMWYFSMLILFYFVTPMVLWKDSLLRKIVVSVTLFVIFELMVLYAGSDIRLVYYFPFYTLGLILPNVFFTHILKKRVFFVISMFFLILLVFAGFYNYLSDLYLFKLLLMLFGVFTIIGSCFIIYKPSMQNVVRWGGYSSMCVFLFHRPILEIFHMLFGERLSILTIILLVAVYFAAGFAIQKIYDIIMAKILIHQKY